MIEVFIQAFVLYFVVIDPIGNTPIFMSITQSQNAKEKYIRNNSNNFHFSNDCFCYWIFIFKCTI